jgi:hypothetical protein
VEDSIEHQLKTLHMVYTEPATRILTQLATELEKQGDMYLTVEIDNLTKDFVKTSDVDVEDTIPKTRTTVETTDVSPRQTFQMGTTDVTVSEEKTEAVDFVKAVQGRFQALREMITSLNEKILENDAKMVEGHPEEGVEAFEKWNKSATSLEKSLGADFLGEGIPDPGQIYNSLSGVLGRMVDFTEEYVNTTGDLEIDRTLVNDDLEDVGAFRPYFDAINGEIRKMKKVQGYTSPDGRRDTSLDRARQILGIDKDPSAEQPPVVEGDPVAKTITKTPPGEGKPANPLTKKEQGIATPPGKAIKSVIQKVQEIIGVKPDGIYGKDTHESLNQWLTQTKDKEGDPYQAKAARIFDDVYDFTKGLGWNSTRINRIHNILVDLESTKEVPATDVPQTASITFVSPVTGRTLKNFWFTIAIDEARRNPFHLIRSLQGGQAPGLPRNVSDKEILEKKYLESVGQAITEAVKALGVETEAAANSIAGWYNLLANDARKMLGQPTAKTVVEWTQGNFANLDLGNQLTYSKEAMDSFVKKMYAAGFGDQKGYVIEEAIKGRKREVANLARLAVEENAGTAQSTPQPDPTKAGRPGQNVPQVSPEQQVDFYRLPTNDKRKIQIIIDRGVKEALENPEYENQIALNVEDQIKFLYPRVKGTEFIFGESLRKLKKPEAVHKNIQKFPGPVSTQQTIPQVEKRIQELANYTAKTGKPVTQQQVQTYFVEAQKAGYKGTLQEFAKRISGATQLAQTKRVTTPAPVQTTPVQPQPKQVG